MKHLSDKDRIAQFLNHYKLSKNKAGISIGDKNGMRFQYVENGRNGISEKLAADLVRTYPEVSYKWLLTGEGKMLDKEINDYKIKEDIGLNLVNEPPTNYGTKPTDDKYLIELIETQKKMIEKLEKEIEDLREVTRESSKVNK